MQSRISPLSLIFSVLFWSGCDFVTPLSFCGDGSIDFLEGESCDDGNTTSGDGCSEFCSNESIPNPPNQTELEEAKAQIELALAASEEARRALEILGILPVYDCGEPRGTFIGDVVAQVQLDLPCAQAVAAPIDANTDAVTLTFDQAGCAVKGHTLTGVLVFTYAGAEDGFALVLDAQQLQIDGDPLQATAGYSVCGDQDTFSVTAQGSLPDVPNSSFFVDGSVGIRDGVPVFGGTTLLFNGIGQVTTDAGTTQITLVELEYEVGDILPNSGSFILQTASGNSIQAIFIETSPVTGEVTIIFNTRDPVTIPVISL